MRGRLSEPTSHRSANWKEARRMCLLCGSHLKHTNMASHRIKADVTDIKRPFKINMSWQLEGGGRGREKDDTKTEQNETFV